jgi:hypothetical protein
VLEDLLGLHHRVHRGVGLGVAGLRAEPAVLGAAARLRVHERAHVGRVSEPVGPDLPGALDERPDVVVLGELRELHRLFEADQRCHPTASLEWVRGQARSGPGRFGIGAGDAVVN